MRINWRDILAVCDHPDKFGDHKHCESRDIMFLICQVTSRHHMFKSYVTLMVKASNGISPACYLGDCWDVNYLNCHVTSQTLERSWYLDKKFM